MLELLGRPLNPRSHFLPATPVIVIGQDVYLSKRMSDDATFVIHHEYYHYESCSLWPPLLLGRIYDSFSLMQDLLKLHGITVRAPREFDDLRKLQGAIPFASTGWDDSKVAARQGSGFKIGLAGLLEGQAIMDCFLKAPDCSLSSIGLSIVEDLFKYRNLESNREHIIGTETCLATIGLGNQEFRKDSLRPLLQLAAMVPDWVIWGAMSEALLNLGMSINEWDYLSVRNFILEHLSEVVSAYETILCRNLISVFTDRKFLDLFEKQLQPDTKTRDRDLEIVGTHALASLLFAALQQAIPAHTPAYLRFIANAGSLSALKLYEATDEPTLKDYNAPYLRPERIPVPALLFREGGISGIWIEYPDPSERKFIVHASGSSMSVSQVHAWWVGCSLICARAFVDALKKRRSEIICPFYNWVHKMHAQIGNDEERTIFTYLAHMCNSSLRSTADGKLLSEIVTPSPEYCRCLIDSAPASSRCLFKSVARAILMPSSSSLE
jgi:hypothetical protein